MYSRLYLLLLIWSDYEENFEDEEEFDDDYVNYDVLLVSCL
jgi:hypothetical protein